MNSSKSDANGPKQEFDGSAAKKKKLVNNEDKSVKPKQAFGGKK
jgi:hypothetical protein